MLKQAFNAITRIHSRPVTLVRFGSPDIYSPARATPANYFRFLEGPSSTVIRGREFVIPIDTMTGQQTQLVSFSNIPTTGEFILTYNGNDTTGFTEVSTAGQIQTALRLLSGLAAVTVVGDFTIGLTVTFIGVATPLLLVATRTFGDKLDATITVKVSGAVPWSERIKRGDKIIHDIYGRCAVDEVIEMCDIGGDIMGYRVRTE